MTETRRQPLGEAFVPAEVGALAVPTEGRPLSAPGSDILVGIDGNAFSILGTTRKALKDAEASRAFIDAYTNLATQGDYHHLLRVSMAFLDAEAE